MKHRGKLEEKIHIIHKTKHIIKNKRLTYLVTKSNHMIGRKKGSKKPVITVKYTKKCDIIKTSHRFKLFSTTFK